MKIRQTYKDMSKMYLIGIDEDTHTYVLSVVMHEMGMGMGYFRLTDEEFSYYPNDKEKLDQLADECALHKHPEKEIKQ